MILLLQKELADTNQEVMLLTLELEQRVAERTAQLSKANRSLEREVRERRQAEAEIRKLNADLEQRAVELQAANKDLEAFSYSVSHDLRAPLRHIGGYAAMLGDALSDGSDEEVHAHIRSIARQAKKMGQLIDDLLQFSRMSRVAVKSSLFELGPLVDGVVAELAPETKDRNVEWKIHSLPTVYGDTSLIRYALINLLSNALKYSRPRDPAIIEVDAKPGESSEVVISVRDNGVGFDPGYAHKLFGVFERLHSERDFEGTGIGLANVHRIVERHGGRTWAEGQINESATFYFTLPLTGPGD